MKKICHITSVHNRYDVRIFEKECTSLASAGHKVYLLVNDMLKNEEKNGVYIVSTKFFSSKRVKRIIKSQKIMFKRAMDIDAEIYHLHDPELLPIAAKLIKKGKKVIYDAHEDTELQIRDKKWIPKLLRDVISKGFRAYLNHSIKKMSGVVTVTPHLVKKFKAINNKTIMVTNYPIIQQKKEQISIEKKETILCFLGSITENWHHENVIKSIEKFENVKYVLAGSADEDYLCKLEELKGWNNVIYLGRIPYSEVAKVYESADIGIALDWCSQGRGEGTLGNTKLFEVMEAGLPLVCSNYRLWKKIVEKDFCGIAVNPKDCKAIKKAIKFLIANKEKAVEMGQNGRTAVERKYNWETQKIKLLKFYNNI